MDNSIPTIGHQNENLSNHEIAQQRGISRNTNNRSIMVGLLSDQPAINLSSPLQLPKKRETDMISYSMVLNPVSKHSEFSEIFSVEAENDPQFLTANEKRDANKL